jgi:hypothetical protein
VNKYEVLVSILDKIRLEAIGLPIEGKYLAPSGDAEKVNQARARAFIHLYLMVSFGILDFQVRERVITDKGYDGGIDAYYIDNENRLIYLIQSKFRTNDKNFAEKNISVEEILAMDIGRILEGNDTDENGNPYNGKIKQLIREVSQIENISRYKQKVIILANIAPFTPDQIRRLFDGNKVEVFDHEQCFNRLVFPVVSGTFFNATELHIAMDLSNKNAGSKIRYEVKTELGYSEITVLFVPTFEIAKTLSKYKNSILKYNPRSYLELEGKKVNTAIRETITERDTNEFALFNNGITMISDDTDISEKVGQLRKAQLAVKNPQIINGGQTAFTLSKIYESMSEEEAKKVFEGKEVLLKVITLLNDEEMFADKIRLIDDISTATNQQTPVIEADRASNEPIYERLQEMLYSRYGIFFERKRGEFGDGIVRGYIDKSQVIERNLFLRLYLSSQGDINRSISKKLFVKYKMTDAVLTNIEALDQFYFAYLCYHELDRQRGASKRKDREFYGFLFILAQRYRPADLKKYVSSVDQAIDVLNLQWVEFVESFAMLDVKFTKVFTDKETGERRSAFNPNAWYRHPEFENDVKDYFGIYREGPRELVQLP